MLDPHDKNTNKTSLIKRIRQSISGRPSPTESIPYVSQDHFHPDLDMLDQDPLPKGDSDPRVGTLDQDVIDSISVLRESGIADMSARIRKDAPIVGGGCFYSEPLMLPAVDDHEAMQHYLNDVMKSDLWTLMASVYKKTAGVKNVASDNSESGASHFVVGKAKWSMFGPAIDKKRYMANGEYRSLVNNLVIIKSSSVLKAAPQAQLIRFLALTEHVLDPQRQASPSPDSFSHQ